VHSKIAPEGVAQYGLDEEDNVVQLEDASLALDEA
jgi:hypothetical protein